MRWMWIAAGLGATLAISLLLDGQQIVGRPRTYQAAVMQALDQRHIPYTHVQISDSCPPAAQCWGESRADAPAHAEVLVEATQKATGWVDYRRARRDCLLTLAALDIYAKPLRPLAQEPAWLWRLRQYQQALAIRLRVWMQNFSSANKAAQL